MPIYEYKCAACGATADVQHGFRESHEEPCAQCGGKMVRVFTPAGIVFKGSGFYVNDSRAKRSGAGSEKSSDGTGAESKPADAATAKSEGAATGTSGGSVPAAQPAPPADSTAKSSSKNNESAA